MHVDAIICTHDDAETIETIVSVATCSPVIDQVVVVDAASSDATPDLVAGTRGTRLVNAEAGHRRGAYDLVGIEACLTDSDAGAFVFLDPDLVGLTQAHIETLTWSVRNGECGMACGLYDRGPLVNQVFARMLPIVDTQRVVRREVLRACAADSIAAFGLEPVLNDRCAALRVPTHSVVLPRLRYRVDPERGRPPLGLWREHAALGKRLFSYATYQLSHRLPAAPQEAPGRDTAAA